MNRKTPALPGEGRGYTGSFGEPSDSGVWWSATEGRYGESACGLGLISDDNVERLNGSYKGAGYSVRCLRD